MLGRFGLIFALITVLSLMLLPGDPPPDTDTEFDSGVPAFDATFTVTVIGGKLAPPFSTLLVVQFGSTVQFHVAPPFIDTSVIPDGAVSVTVTVPLVGTAPIAFDTVTLYVAPFCPCVKFPVCDLAILRRGEFTTTAPLFARIETGCPDAPVPPEFESVNG
jgi:hypothetical protein